MPDKIFINLPVTDLARARRFYEGLGFTINEAFSDDTAVSVVVSEHIFGSPGPLLRKIPSVLSSVQS